MTDELTTQESPAVQPDPLDQATVTVENVSHLPYGGRTRETNFHFPPTQVRCVPGRSVAVPFSAFRAHHALFANLVREGYVRLSGSSEVLTAVQGLLEQDNVEAAAPVVVDPPEPNFPMDSAARDITPTWDKAMLQDPMQPEPPADFTMPVAPPPAAHDAEDTPAADGVPETPPAPPAAEGDDESLVGMFPDKGVDAAPAEDTAPETPLAKKKGKK